MLQPSDKALVPFVSVDDMMKLIHHIGIESMLKGIADYIEADFHRWELFDKTPRIASHSQEGVIDANLRRRGLWLQVCKRPPKKH
jgi:ornithine cyclodeaminase